MLCCDQVVIQLAKAMGLKTINIVRDRCEPGSEFESLAYGGCGCGSGCDNLSFTEFFVPKASLLETVCRALDLGKGFQ